MGHLTEGQRAALRALRNFVRARKTAYDALKSADPASPETKEAQALFERARLEYRAFAGRIRTGKRTVRPND